MQIAHGLHYLDSQSFVHGDLAACNMMRTSTQQARSDVELHYSTVASLARYREHLHCVLSLAGPVRAPGL